jgi:methionyl-tRNA formyltransferase
MKNKNNLPFVFFGTPNFAVDTLDILKNADLEPSLIVTAPDRAKGRGQQVSPSPVAIWAQKHNIPILQPDKINKAFINNLKQASPDAGWPLFTVVAYGKILPAELIYMPNHNTLNIHPSLLPKLRGPAPIRNAILEEKSTGVSIIELDETMDHGPIVAQKEIKTNDWPPTQQELTAKLVKTGAELLAEIIPKWISDEITPIAQDHSQATYSRKFTSDDGEINLSNNPQHNLRKIRAFTTWPKAFFYTKDKNRVLITQAHLKNDELVIDRVKPAGRKEISYQTFLNRS